MDSVNYLKFIAAFALVMGLMLLLAHFAKRFNLASMVTINRGVERRLKVVELLPVDARRKLAIVRRDNVEHLLLLGINSETVVETNIQNSDRKIERLKAS